MAVELPEGAHLNPIIRNAYDCETWRDIDAGTFAYVGRIRCRDRDGLEVALKIIRRQHLDVSAADRTKTIEAIRLEYDAARRLKSRFVVRPTHVWLYDEDPLFAALEMELVEGESLYTHLKRNPTPSLPTAYAFAHALFSGLADAHEAKIIHRDISPANILLPATGDPVLKITDFGIARVGLSVKLSTEAARANIMYVAPEQVADPPVDITPKVDVYSACYIVYELLTGRHPFAHRVAGGIWLDALVEHRATARTPPRVLNPEVPEAVNDIVLRGISADASVRPSAAELEAAFGAVLATVATHATPTEALAMSNNELPLDPEQPTSPESATAARRAVMSRTGLVGATLGALLVVACFLFVNRNRPDPVPVQPAAQATAQSLPPSVGRGAARPGLKIVPRGETLWLVNESPTVAREITLRVGGIACARIGEIAGEFAFLVPDTCAVNGDDRKIAAEASFDGGRATRQLFTIGPSSR